MNRTNASNKIRGLRCWVEIDLAAFERNVKRIQAALPKGMRYISVVKADAYGHGMPQMVRRLMQSGVDCFAVANIKEAAEIRDMGAGWPILILSPLLPEEDDALIEYDLIPTISSIEEARRFNTIAQKHSTTLKFHLKIDTGMGRLGVWHTEALHLHNEISKFSNLRLAGIYTHFSSADIDPEFTQTQRVRFLKCYEALKLPSANQDNDLIVHADNSAGLDSLPDRSPFNAVRIGLLQFGIPPYPTSMLGNAKVEPILDFRTKIGLIKQLPKGTAISYGKTLTLERDTSVAVLTGGYGDGIPLGLSNSGSVIIKGHRCSILGRVTMDQTIVDVSNINGIQCGDSVILIGSEDCTDISASEFSETANTIPWESLCSITKRVPRIYSAGRDI